MNSAAQLARPAARPAVEGRRRLLGRALQLSALALAVAAGTPFVASMQPSAAALNDAEEPIGIGDLLPGEPRTLPLWGMPLFLLKPSADQLAAIAQLDPHVADRRWSGWVPELGVFAYWGFNRFGGPLQHQPPGLSPTEARSWLGGYWSDQGEASYDYAGRAIIDAGYTYNGFTYPHNLRAPQARVSAGKLVVSRRLQK